MNNWQQLLLLLSNSSAAVSGFSRRCCQTVQQHLFDINSSITLKTCAASSTQ
jgi:hypothetical protein